MRGAMKSMSDSSHDLVKLAEGNDDDTSHLSAGGPLHHSDTRARSSRVSVESSRPTR